MTRATTLMVTGSLVPAFRRIGLAVAAMAAIVAFITWPRAYDLQAYLEAARLSAAGGDPYAGTRAAGLAEWGQGQVFVSPPFVAHVLAPFASLPLDVVFVGWTVASLLLLLATIRLVDRDTLVAQAPVVVFSLVYVWGSLWMGQVNLFALAGLLLAFGSRREGLAGLGLALATVTRAFPGAFAVVFLIERRWRALAWAAVALLLAFLVRPSDWFAYVSVAREASTLPTLPVPVQTSLVPYPVIEAVAVAMVLVVVAISAVVAADRRLLAGTAIGMGIVILPTNAWHHWLVFALAPLLLYGDRHAWGRAVLLAFVVVSILPLGWLSALVCLATLVALVAVSLRNLRDAWPLLRLRLVGILGRP